jgi:hypothetical protein
MGKKRAAQESARLAKEQKIQEEQAARKRKA